MSSSRRKWSSRRGSRSTSSRSPSLPPTRYSNPSPVCRRCTRYSPSTPEYQPSPFLRHRAGGSPQSRWRTPSSPTLRQRKACPISRLRARSKGCRIVILRFMSSQPPFLMSPGLPEGMLQVPGLARLDRRLRLVGIPVVCGQGPASSPGPPAPSCAACWAHPLVPPAPHGFGMGVETAVELRPRQARLLLETWPETPILPKRSFSQRRLSMFCWFSETFIICHNAI